jgi:SAM-dependent methyltransferase
MDSGFERYGRYGQTYASFNPINEQALAWYLKFARATGGPILELACGTGRLLYEIAQAGFDVAGIDLSKTMMGIAEKQMSHLSPDIRSHIKLHMIDMTDFHLDQDFGLVILSSNSLSELETRDKQLSCFRCTLNHLRPGGKFLVTVRRFDPSLYVDGRYSTSWSQPMGDSESRNRLVRRVESRLIDDDKNIRQKFYYKIIRPNGTETVEEYSSSFPVMLTEDYISLFAQSGFTFNAYVDYKEKPDDGKSPILCFVGCK